MRILLAPILLATACAIGLPPRESPLGTARNDQGLTDAPSAPLADTAPSPSAEPVEAPLLSEPSDLLELLWSHRLNFAAGGSPLVTIRLMEGQPEIAFRARAAGRIRPRGGRDIPVLPGRTYRVRAHDALPAALTHRPLLAEVPFRDREALDAAQKRWSERGISARQRIIGGVYGIAGRVVDNRRLLLLADGDGSEAWADALASQIQSLTGERPPLFTDLLTRPTGRLEILGPDDQPLGSADAALGLEVDGDAGFALLRTEHDTGYASHGFEDRIYPGRLFVTIDSTGRLAAVHGIALEQLLRGLVPSEMPASAPLEALKAQAVTARSNVLAQIGTRHLTDPYVLCSEVHCQAYKGETAQAASTDLAVRATSGEALFGRVDQTLVDAVYSAVCGGHGEDNDAVWSGDLPSSHLRGQPDLPPDQGAAWSEGLQSEARLRAFLAAAPIAYCRRATGAPKDRFRWERRLSAATVAAQTATLGVGAVSSIEVLKRGVSGRARSIRIRGDLQTAQVDGELRIRRLFGNLPSSMFLVELERGEFVFRGGGWGHGAGMCQWGAIGRAQAGQSYREILRAYYAGAEPAQVY